jgi:hypothetical protein
VGPLGIHGTTVVGMIILNESYLFLFMVYSTRLPIAQTAQRLTRLPIAQTAQRLTIGRFSEQTEERCGTKPSSPDLRYYPSIILEGLRKPMTSLSQHNWPPGLGLNSGPLEYEAGVPTTRPRRSVEWLSKSVDWI